MLRRLFWNRLFLEANLIKKHWPKYNIREKDDRSFRLYRYRQSGLSQANYRQGQRAEKFSQRFLAHFRALQKFANR